MGEIFAGLSASEPSPTRRTPEAEAVVRQIVAAHALLMNESDISPRNEKINRALRGLVALLLLPYSPSEAATILNHAEVAALRMSLLDRLSEAELALEEFWSQRFLSRKTLAVSDLKEFLYWRHYERLLGLESQALSAMQRQKRRVIAFVGGGPLPLSAILLQMRTGEPVLCIDADAEASECAKRLLSKLGLSRIRAVHAEGADFDYGSASAVFIASLVGRKVDVARRVVQTRQKPLVAVRTVDGVRALLYCPADLAALKAVGLSFAARTDPDAETINSTLFFNAGPL